MGGGFSEFAVGERDERITVDFVFFLRVRKKSFRQKKTRANKIKSPGGRFERDDNSSLERIIISRERPLATPRMQ